MEKEINLHINNGGVSISIEKQVDDFGDRVFVSPTLVIESSHFGHQTNQMKLHLDKEQLEAIGKWMISESSKISEWSDVNESDIELSIIEKKDKE